MPSLMASVTRKKKKKKGKVFDKKAVGIVL
jgi:hypothetical protein